MPATIVTLCLHKKVSCQELRAGTVKHITSEIAPFITLMSSDHIHTSKDDLVQYASYNCQFMSP